jgi:hypothetical protein
MRLRPILAYLACLVLTLACGGGGDGANISLGGGTPTGNLTVRLGSDSFPGYNQVVLSIEKLEGSTDGTTWTPLGNVRTAVDLMLLQNGNSTAILSAVSVPMATYTQFRLTWATVNYSSGYTPSFVFASSAQSPLTMPVTTVLSGSVKVATTGTSTALLMLSGQQAVQNHPAGLTPYTFQATGSAYDQSATAHLVGQLVDGTTRLGGAEVYAETVDANGLATVQRRAFTDLSGNYALEGLPIGSTYYVAAQPGNTSSSYQALASAPVIAATATTYTANLAFANPQTPAFKLTFQVTPASSAAQVTWAELRKTLATGSGSQALIVRSQTLDTNILDGTFIYGLFPDTYDVDAQRSTSGAAPVMKAGVPSKVTLSSGASSTATVKYP